MGQNFTLRAVVSNRGEAGLLDSVRVALSLPAGYLVAPMSDNAQDRGQRNRGMDCPGTIDGLQGRRHHQRPGSTDRPATKNTYLPAQITKSTDGVAVTTMGAAWLASRVSGQSVNE